MLTANSFVMRLAEPCMRLLAARASIELARADGPAAGFALLPCRDSKGRRHSLALNG
jgi:hypothetical protein